MLGGSAHPAASNVPDWLLMPAYVLVQDNDAHWYVIPADQRIAWGRWCDCDDADESNRPEWSVPVNGRPSCVTFAAYEIR